jgi:hypothetical protein
MSHTPANLVHQTAVTTGTGNFTLTKVNGKQDFPTAFTTVGTNVFDYFISNRDAAEWERGTGSCPTTATLRRDTVIETHAGTTAAINFSAGTKDVINDIPALDQVRATTVASSGALAVLDTTAGNILKGASLIATTAILRPTSNDGIALGTGTQAFADLFLASGSVVNFNNSDVTITHGADELTFAGAASGVSFSSPLKALNWSRLGLVTTQTSTAYTIVDTDFQVTCAAGATMTVTLPDPTAYEGRLIFFKSLGTFTVVSASANVDPIGGGGLGTAILPGTVGKWCLMQAYAGGGGFWVIIATNV